MTVYISGLVSSNQAGYRCHSHAIVMTQGTQTDPKCLCVMSHANVSHKSHNSQPATHRRLATLRPARPGPDRLTAPVSRLLFVCGRSARNPIRVILRTSIRDQLKLAIFRLAMGLLSQPLSRGAALFAVVAVGAALSGSVPKRATPLVLSQFGYLLSLAMIIGIANWTTFVFGLVAFKTLPRQTFGLLQAKLFPKYFQVLTLCLGIALLTFTSVRGQKLNAQLWALLIALACNIANMLVIEPMTTATMFEKHKLERTSGADAADAAASNAQPSSAELKRLGKRFGMLHGISSLLNLFTLGAAHVHLWNLATSLATV